MDFVLLSIIFGFISILLSVTGVLSLIFAIPGLIFAYLALKGSGNIIPLYQVRKNKEETKFIKEEPTDPKRKQIYFAILLNLLGVILTLFLYFLFLSKSGNT
jgi:hypothetical protein